MTTIKRKHQQLFDIFVHEFQTGLYPKGVKLPKIMELAQKYSVSVNIATKAVELLKEAGYVISKAGDGIYSIMDVEDLSSEIKYAGEKLFSEHLAAKTINIWVEDSQDWQIKFWNAFFKDFSRENPDVAFDVCFGLNDKAAQKKHDMLIGGFHFFNAAGLNIADLFDTNIIDSFYPGLYTGMALTPEDIAWKKQCKCLPIAVQIPVIVNKGADYKLSSNDNILDFIEKLSSPARFKIWSLRLFLANCGMKYFDPDTGKFMVTERKKWENIMVRIKELFDCGDILPLHGAPLDYDKIFKKEIGHSLNYVEVSLIQKASLNAANLDFAPYPIGDVFPLNPVCGFINKKSRYPEECLRLIKAFIAEKTQKSYLNNCLGLPLNKSILAKTEFSYLLEKFEKTEKVLVIPPELALEKAIEKVLCWELYYYFCGKTKGDIISRIEQKMAFFIENSQL
jgi:DNA-binding transcriptional regulator YhcF (GntR family)